METDPLPAQGWTVLIIEYINFLHMTNICYIFAEKKKMNPLYEYLEGVKDHRRAQGKRTPMSAFLEMIILAGMSGRFGFRGISRFITSNEQFFVKRYNLEHGTPSYTTLRNFMKELEFDSISSALSSWALQYIKGESWVSIDGKAIGSTVTNSQSSEQNFKSMVSLFCSDSGLVLNTTSIENKKEHEGQAARELIALFDKKGITFTLDALHCQKKLRKPSWSQEMIM